MAASPHAVRKAALEEMQIRVALSKGLSRWLADSGMTQVEAAKTLRVTQARISDIKCGRTRHFSMDRLVRMAARAGLRPKLVWESTDLNQPVEGFPVLTANCAAKARL